MAVSQRNQSDAPLPSNGNAAPRVYDPLLGLLPIAVFTISTERKVRTINLAAVQMLGYPSERAVGLRCDQIFQCSFCGGGCAALEAGTDGMVHRDFPVEIAREDGQRRHVLIDAVPLEGGEVAVLVRDVTESERYRRSTTERWNFHGIVCASDAMKEVIGRIRDVSPYDSTVLILGESGTGKELVARAIHAEGTRSGRPFVVVNCSAYSETLLESELFGHAKGSFTGADRDRRGRFELADGGTVLLDEIGEISPKIQVKLLRVLQEREIERVGESRARPVDLRILAATNRDLLQEVRDGRFREDLYYRLNVFTIQLPPLRERREDIPVLADAILERLRERTGKQVSGVSQEVLTTLMEHRWPGNIRELENVLESAVVRARGETLLEVDLPVAFTVEPVRAPHEEMREALQRTAGCVTRAARLLGVHRTTLWRHMRELGISRDEFLLG